MSIYFGSVLTNKLIFYLWLIHISGVSLGVPSNLPRFFDQNFVLVRTNLQKRRFKTHQSHQTPTRNQLTPTRNQLTPTRNQQVED